MKLDADTNAPQSTYAIADLQLAFDNGEVQNMLQKRAVALRSGKFEKVRKIQEEMTKYKNENFEELTTPKVFYATFHHEYAYHKAVEVNKKEQFSFLNVQSKIRDATEPTDIIWENYDQVGLCGKLRVRWCCA